MLGRDEFAGLVVNIDRDFFSRIRGPDANQYWLPAKRFTAMSACSCGLAIPHQCPSRNLKPSLVNAPATSSAFLRAFTSASLSAKEADKIMSGAQGVIIRDNLRHVDSRKFEQRLIPRFHRASGLCWIC